MNMDIYENKKGHFSKVKRVIYDEGKRALFLMGHLSLGKGTAISKKNGTYRNKRCLVRIEKGQLLKEERALLES